MMEALKDPCFLTVSIFLSKLVSGMLPALSTVHRAGVF